MMPDVIQKRRMCGRPRSSRNTSSDREGAATICVRNRQDRLSVDSYEKLHLIQIPNETECYCRVTGAPGGETRKRSRCGKVSARRPFHRGRLTSDDYLVSYPAGT